MRPWPAWLVFILFVPLQIYLAWVLFTEWGFWASLGFLLVLGFVGNRASRAPMLMMLFAPHWAVKRERRRHVFQGILFLGAGVLLLLHYGGFWTYGPLLGWFDLQPGLPLLSVLMATTLVKSAVR